ncbi:MAG: class II aldolase/adducin family protein [Alphaproteobacteria bacterium]
MSVASVPDERSVRANVSDEEWKLRVDLAALYRLVALQGWDDMVFTHLSLRVPGPEHHFLINPFGQLFEEVTASSLVKIDQNGEKVLDTPYSINPAGFVIHSAVHMAREDAHCVMHLHTDDGVGVAAQEQGLLPISQHAMVIGKVAYHDYEGIALDLDERARLIEDLGRDKTVMILRNHGTLAIGRNCAAAWVRMWHLERACTMQTRALSGGTKLSMPNQGVPEKAAGLANPGFDERAPQAIWPAMLRKLDRIDQSYRH